MNYSERQSTQIGGRIISELVAIISNYHYSPDEKINQLRKTCRVFDKKYNDKLCQEEIDKWIKLDMKVMI